MRTHTTTRPLLAALLLVSCIGGGDGTAGGLTPPPTGGGPVVGGAGALAAPGLTSAVAGANSIHVTWSATDTSGQPLAVAVFRSTTRANLYSGPPATQATQDGQFTFNGLGVDQDHFLGFALRTGPNQFEPTGAVLVLHTNPPVFVRAGADPMAADGLSPATAYAHPFEGVLRAFANGGGNVWISEGVYADTSLPVFAGVHLFGGFDSAFDPNTRDSAVHATRLVGRAGASVVEVAGAAEFATLDGLAIEGAGLAPVGISVTDTPISLRDLEVTDCSGRGIRIRNQSTDRLESHALGVRCIENGGDGLSGLGPFEFCIERCVFSSNVQEGVDFDDLIGLDGEDSTLIVSGSRFFGNGTQGLDVDLAAPPGGGGLGSRFDVKVTGSSFEHNGQEGLLIDLDFDLVAGWSARVEVGHCTSRANRGTGFHLDLDGESSALLHHCLATANAEDGILVTSESTPALAVISSSAMTGNASYGVRASLGNAPVLLSQCVLSGNALGGASSTQIESSAVSCIAHEQAAPFTGFREVANLRSNAGDDVFANVANSWRFATALQGNQLSVANPMSIVPGDVLQIAGDGVARTVLAVDPINGVRLDSTPLIFQAPARIALLPAGASGAEDFRLTPQSLAIGVGFAPPGSSADAGIFATPGGSPPGSNPAGAFQSAPIVRLKLSSITPPLHTLVAQNQTVTALFTGAELDGASADSMSVRALSAGGTELGMSLATVGRELRISPPAAGWPSGAWTIELHRFLASTQGEAFSSPVALPLRSP